MKNLETINISQYGYSILQIETMSVCNMRCSFCAYPVRNDKGEVLSEDIVYSVIDSLHTDDSFEYICFSHFNEPLLDNRIYDFVKYSKDPEELSPSQVLKVTARKPGSYTVEEIYLNSGEPLSGSSVAAVFGDTLLIGSVFDPRLLLCKL